MVFSGAEIRNSLAGVWQIFKGNPQGLRGFDLSIAGFWRSFLIVVPLMIPYLLVSKAQLQIAISEFPGAENLELQAFYWVEAGRLLLDWVAFPVVLAVLARPLGLTRHYVGFIVVRNWSELLAAIPLLAAALLYGIGVVGLDGFTFVSLVATGIALYLRFRVARVALEASVSFALGIVIFDMALSTVISLGFSRLVSLG
ncbi:hypothetical protein C8N35_101722 [Breoghania corrubedonensis]|uniref:Uncharacterized protein n=1 Tax=Breoghania corrubedonensis TaxID=665038 RepID=A0A2T5VFZ5_9HYPH|nr:hypothetical protein [Breoghania corrubedonensis]PTW62675.1 hypothetical protein C8N35_101722 [Breoghania corrubedonensis]